MVARLIEQSLPLLNRGGHLILEIGTAQEQPVRASSKLITNCRAPTIYDLQKHPHVIRAVKLTQ